MRLWIGILALGVLVAAPAGADVDEGKAQAKPWSGYWWPSQRGELVKPRDAANPSPLAKYDRAKGAHAEEWERKMRYDPGLPKWDGRCHAWAAASALEPEPKHDVTVNGVHFTVRDIKALLTLVHD